VKPAYEHRHVVTFEETNLLGNVYYVHFIRWQGVCREMFLRDHAPEVLADLGRDLVLSTVECSCRYGRELHALDAVVIRMRLGSIVWNRFVLEFEYLREEPAGDRSRLDPVATGSQEIACMTRDGERLVEREIPQALLRALEPYRGVDDSP
jgi:enediyne biosynthesis thioesterase